MTPSRTTRTTDAPAQQDTAQVSAFHVYDFIPPGTVPALDAALDAYAWRLGTPATPGTPAIPGDPLADPPIPDIPAVPPTEATQGTLTHEDEIGVIVKTAAQSQGYAQQTLLKTLFLIVALEMTPLPPLPEPPAADGSTPPARSAASPSFESIP